MFSKWQLFLNFALSIIESAIPKVKTLSEDECRSRQYMDYIYIPEDIYYFTEDLSFRWKQRVEGLRGLVRAVLRLDGWEINYWREQVSFFRKREELVHRYRF